MELTKRLQAVADMVTRGHRVSDVGCDHAYISIYLIKNKISPSVIAMDVNKGPLDIAKNNILKKGYSDKIQTRLSDGLDKLSINEVDTIIIAGMGGGLTCKILKQGLNILKTVKELVLQPQSEPHLVRKFLEDNKDTISFNIQEEKMLIDDGKYYLVIKASQEEPGQCDLRTRASSEVYQAYGRQLLERKDPILHQYLLEQSQTYNRIKDKLEKTKTENTKQRLVEINKQIELINIGLDFYKI